ncbi:hypothetical protein [Microbispora sp. NBC_01389]|uniref:hypothetical protein n=1 Tax=Microbispora sp. NBC_01389 TaxID=2903584 RepID=UPI003249AD08
MRDRVRLSLDGGRFAEDQFAQVAVTQAASEIGSAILQADRNVREVYEHAVRGETIPAELRLWVHRDQVPPPSGRWRRSTSCQDGRGHLP